MICAISFKWDRAIRVKDKHIGCEFDPDYIGVNNMTGHLLKDDVRIITMESLILAQDER